MKEMTMPMDKNNIWQLYGIFLVG
uniref:Uncharacterized protein n=1 Tax=Rhizophora mucronata TaxID=61149 RepID=A0A2P2KM47_RHIMU